jgi:hypothetical protein
MRSGGVEEISLAPLLPCSPAPSHFVEKVDSLTLRR